MSHLTLRTKDLTFERSKVRSGGVHNFEGFTRSPTAADKALLYKGSPSTSHVFGHATALNNKTFLQDDSKKEEMLVILYLQVITRHFKILYYNMNIAQQLHCILMNTIKLLNLVVI